MSQAGIINISGGGGGGTPIQTVTGNSGGPVSPTANNINIVGGVSNINDSNGITVIGTPGTSTETITLTNTQNDSVTTNDATPTIISIFTMPIVPAVQNYEYKISALNVTDSLGAVYLVEAGARTTGLASFSLNTADITTIEETTMSGCLVAFGVSGNTVTLTVTGLAGKTIRWSSNLTFNQVI